MLSSHAALVHEVLLAVDSRPAGRDFLGPFAAALVGRAEHHGVGSNAGTASSQSHEREAALQHERCASNDSNQSHLFHDLLLVTI